MPTITTRETAFGARSGLTASAGTANGAAFSFISGPDGLMELVKDMRMSAVWAGLTAFIWYAFGALPLQIEIAAQLGLSPAQASNWVFIIWFAGSSVSILLSLICRIPLPVTWTLPGLVYLGTLGGQYSFAEIVGANLVAGIAIVALGVLGIGKRIMAWLPLPIIMGMFGGSILVFVTRMVNAAVEDAAVAGVTVASYLLGRFIGSPRVPPMGLAIGIGGIAVYCSGATSPEAVTWALPVLVTPEMTFSFSAILAIAVPMVVLAMGLGNVQGIGFLQAQGYRVPVTKVTVIVGLTSIVNAFFGGHAATVARAASAIIGGPEAGPRECRYWANIVAAALCFFIAFAASCVISLVEVLPRSFVVTLAALAILSSFPDALQKAFGSTLRFGSLAAFAVAATPFAIFGIASTFWALLAGVAASFLTERHDLIAYWRDARSSEPRRPVAPTPSRRPSAATERPERRLG